MANNYKVKTYSNSTTGTSQALFTASAATTIVKSVLANCDKTTPNVNAILRIKKSGGTEEMIKRQNITVQNSSYEMLYDVLPLEVGDALYAQSDDTDITWIMSWVESTTSVIGQSIDVLSDVDTTGKANGDVLTYNSTSGNWEAEASAGGGGNNFGTISVATQSNVVADASNDTLTFAVAGGMAITTNATTDTVTFDSARLDDDDVTLSGVREIDLNGENLNIVNGALEILLIESDGVRQANTVIADYGGTVGGKITLAEATANGGNSIAIQAPASIAASTTYTLPSADGTSGQVLATDSTGGLSWATRSSLAFSTIAVSGQSNVVADSASDTLTIAAGSGITITTDAGADSVTIAATGGGGGTPAGSTGYIQYNTGGAFDAEAALYYDATNNRLSVGGDTTPAGTITSRGAGNTTGIAFQTENSSGVARAVILDEGTMTITEANTGMAYSRCTLALVGTKADYQRGSLEIRHTNVSNPFTSIFSANTCGQVVANDFVTGGIAVQGVSTSTATASPFFFGGVHGSTAPTSALLTFQGQKNNGSGGYAVIANTEKLVRFRNLNTEIFAILGSRAVGIGNTAPTSTTSLTVRGQGASTNNTLLVENSGGTARFTVRDDGAYAFAGGTVGAAQTGYTTFTNLSTDRTCDANATTVEELADILGTLIVDLKTKGIIAA